MTEKCPLQKDHGEFICRDGVLWALTYSENEDGSFTVPEWLAIEKEFV